VKKAFSPGFRADLGICSVANRQLRTYHENQAIGRDRFPRRPSRSVQPEETMRRHARTVIGIALVLSLTGGATADDGLASAVESIKPGQILDHIKVLASDEFEGRGPGTPGEDKTIAYLTGQFQKMGLKPGNPDGTFVQSVPLVGFQAKRVEGAFEAGSRTIGLSFPNDFVGVSRRNADEIKVEKSDVVFVGYGVVAPEYGWDDYKGLDVRGKTLIMLVNDPPVPDPKDPSKLDPAVFKGRAMTYYGRWTYKYEIASEKGAAAAILVHETGPAGYPFEVVKGSWSRENFDIAQPQTGQTTARVAVEGWITFDKAKELFAACGRDLDSLKRAAVQRDFHPELLGAAARFAITNVLRTVNSRNVVARLEGSDPTHKSESIIYTAHWDHLGRDAALQGDQIYNGAADNASGVAAVLEIARAFNVVKPAPKRSIVFLCVTAEEQGLLGAKYYATHPLYPLERTLADVNLDVINLWGPTTDLISIGMGNSTLDDLLVEIARMRGRTVTPDADPEKGYYFRSDHFEFAKQGVPALDPKGGREYVGKSADFGKQKQAEYTAKDYHKPSDQVKPDWDLSGAAADLGILLELGYRVAQGDRFPEWKPGTEFKARREAMLKSYKP
jgi:Zn-dependent M28 family amino/carboxypeptidase